MSETDLLSAWSRARMQLIVAQFAPTFLLITTVGLVPQVRATGVFAVWATIGILLASGILGALAEFGTPAQQDHYLPRMSAARYAEASAADLAALTPRSHAAQAAVAHAAWLWVPKFLTPAIFVGIFVALVTALLG